MSSLVQQVAHACQEDLLYFFTPIIKNFSTIPVFYSCILFFLFFTLVTLLFWTLALLYSWTCILFHPFLVQSFVVNGSHGSEEIKWKIKNLRQI